jgi:hypothetical protein
MLFSGQSTAFSASIRRCFNREITANGSYHGFRQLHIFREPSPNLDPPRSGASSSLLQGALSNLLNGRVAGVRPLPHVSVSEGPSSSAAKLCSTGWRTPKPPESVRIREMSGFIALDAGRINNRAESDFSGASAPDAFQKRARRPNPSAIENIGPRNIHRGYFRKKLFQSSDFS